MARPKRPLYVKEKDGRITITFNAEGWQEGHTKLAEHLTRGLFEINKLGMGGNMGKALEVYAQHLYTESDSYNRLMRSIGLCENTTNLNQVEIKNKL